MKIQEGVITFIPVAYSIYCLNHSENEKLSCNICSGEAGRDHRGAVQRSGQGWDTVPPTCWGVGGSPGGMVNHSGKLLLKITPEEWCYRHLCVSFLWQWTTWTQVGTGSWITVIIEGMAVCGEIGDVLSTRPLWAKVSALCCSWAGRQGETRWQLFAQLFNEYFWTQSDMFVCSRCAVAMASVKEAELARATANALATRYQWWFFL